MGDHDLGCGETAREYSRRTKENAETSVKDAQEVQRTEAGGP